MPPIRTSEDRVGVLAEFYNQTSDALLDLAKTPWPERKTQCKLLGINPYIFRTMVDYSRYPEARKLNKLIRQCGRRIAGMKVLDFGCLVADYGVFLARRGAKVAVYDYIEEITFAAFRFTRENMPVELFHVPHNYKELMCSRNLVIFGEVLEHLDNPLQPLEACVDASVDFIFTSCFPLGDEAYFSHSGHSKSAQQQQPACLALLRKFYYEIAARKKARLWRRIVV